MNPTSGDVLPHFWQRKPKLPMKVSRHGEVLEALLAEALSSEEDVMPADRERAAAL